MKRPKPSILILLSLAMVSWSCSNAQTASGNGQTSSAQSLRGLNTAFIDKTADPCTDFFQYACGNFATLHPIPPDRAGYGNFVMLIDANQAILRGILDKAAAAGANRGANEQKIGDYYASCMDTAAINEAGLKPLQPELDSIAAIKSKDELTPLLARDQLINDNAFFGLGEQQDFADASKQIAGLYQAGLGLPERDYYLRTGADDVKLRQQYVQHITRMLELVGEPEAQASAGAQKILDFETALAKVSLDIVSQRDPKNIYHMTSVADVEKLAPSIDWKLLLQDTGTPPVTEVNVAEPDFFKGMNTLIDSTDLDTIKTYLVWQLINSIPATALPQALDDENFNFNGKILSGQEQQLPRWKRCVQSTDGALGEALGQQFVAEEFPPSSKAATQQMVRDIEAAMNADIDSLDWMSPETKVKAKAKLQMIANKIGYPDKWRNYSALKIVRGDALGNELRAIEFENHRELDKIGKPVDKGEFGMSPPTVNAYYSPNMNDINFPAGILQPPFYDPHATDAVNYGHIGAVVGHELTHGFDDEGRKFDGNGNLSDWWTPADARQFEEKTDCEVKEYSDFTVAGGVHVNGKLTLGENTADNGGLRLAWAAFLADAKRKAIDLNKKHDGYTPEQQFFLGFAQNWCGEQRPEQEKLQVQTNPHSPLKFRVNGVVRNMPEFGQAFGCKEGQPMEPANACRVW